MVFNSPSSRFSPAHAHEEGKHALDLLDAVFRGLLSSSQPRRLFLGGLGFVFRRVDVACNAVDFLV